MVNFTGLNIFIMPHDAHPVIMAFKPKELSYKPHVKRYSQDLKILTWTSE